MARRVRRGMLVLPAFLLVTAVAAPSAHAATDAQIAANVLTAQQGESAAEVKPGVQSKAAPCAIDRVYGMKFCGLMWNAKGKAVEPWFVNLGLAATPAAASQTFAKAKRDAGKTALPTGPSSFVTAQYFGVSNQVISIGVASKGKVIVTAGCVGPKGSEEQAALCANALLRAQVDKAAKLA